MRSKKLLAVWIVYLNCLMALTAFGGYHMPIYKGALRLSQFMLSTTNISGGVAFGVSNVSKLRRKCNFCLHTEVELDEIAMRVGFTPLRKAYI